MKDGILRKAVLCLALVLSSLAALAQEVTVTVTPVQQVMPPQVMNYIENPGKFFNVQLINNGPKAVNIFFGMRVEQIHPYSGLHVVVPFNRQPQKPITVAPGGRPRVLTMVELKTLFNHVVKNEVETTPGLFDKYTNGSFGLLPEGHYELRLTAYEWNPTATHPKALSSNMSGRCQFTVCYKAQAPQFLQPMTTGTELRDLSVAKMQRQNPQFTWREPVIACRPNMQRYTYDIKVVELFPGQQPDDAMDYNPIVYRQNLLMAPTATIPRSVLQRMKNDKVYLAQVTAHPSSGRATSSLNYIMLENEGKSSYRRFRIVDPVVVTPGASNNPTPSTGGTTSSVVTSPTASDTSSSLVSTDGNKDGKDSGDTAKTEGKDEKTESGSDESIFEVIGITDSIYLFKYPNIYNPTFENGYARKSFVGDNILVQWRHPLYSGGIGERQDTVKFTYDVEVFRSEIGKDMTYLFKNSEPIFKTTVDEAYHTTIPWEKLAEKNSRPGDYLVLRVNPKAKNCQSIRYLEGNENVIDFSIAEHLAKTYFQCSDKVQITNTTLTSTSADKLKGTTVGIGQYQMFIDEIKRVSGHDYFEGKGHVEWKPMGTKVMLAVKFDSLKINSDNIVFGGNAITYDDKKDISHSEAADKIFSEWGLDNIVNDMSIPNSAQIKEVGNNGIENLAQKVDIAEYYKYAHVGKLDNNLFLKGEVSDLHLPVSLPKDINPLPDVDIQIVSMKFSPASATMNVLGQFTLPETDYVKNNILVLGAPRLCISPDDLLPESGTLALLDNFTINDPKSSFDFTFKAPTAVMEPSNGCFISWHANKFEMFDIDVEMTIPKLVKVDDSGNRTEEHPKLRFHTSFRDWNNWFAEGKMDNFEVKDLKNWTFLPGQTIVYDHSTTSNADGMMLPVGYDKTGFSAEQKDAEWQGFYVRNVGIVFPKMLSVTDQGKNWNGRLKLALENLFIDNSGYSFQLGMNDVLDFKTGKVGGWGISMKEIKMEVLQTQFKEAYFNGEIKTPLKGQIGYRCDIYAQGKDAEGVTDPNRSAYIFKTQQVKGLNFDFWLGEMDFDHDQTYFLVEAELVGDKETETKVELCMGGDMNITIGREALKSLGKTGAYVDSKIPGVNISGMRIANCERWKSHYTQNQYESPEMGGMNEFFGWDTEYNIKADKFYFSLGRWSLSTKKRNSGGTAYEPLHAYDTDLLAKGPAPNVSAMNAVQAADDNSGKLGPFDMSLKNFNFGYENNKAILTIGVDISLMDGVLGGGSSVDIMADVDMQEMDFKFDDVKFDSCWFHSGFGGVSVDGHLEVAKGNDEGYSGGLAFALPGNFLRFDAEGGYFKRKTTSEKFAWGYFIAKAESEVGINIPPIQINGLKGGFYFNCKAPTVKGSKPTPDMAKKGVYGGMLGVILSTTAGEKMLRADMDLTVVYDSEARKLSSILFNGTLEALKPSAEGKGLVKADCQLAYVNDVERYIELNVTASGGASLDDAMKGKFMELTGKAYQEGKDIQQGLGDFTKDNHGKTSKEADKSMTTPEITAKCGFSVSLNFKVNFTEGKKSKWHLYIGEPEYKKRCSTTLIDFQVGKKSDSFAAWAYLGSTMYLCLGNELPDNGALPSPPQTVIDFLNGTDVNGNKQSKSADVANAQQNTVNKLKALFNDSKVAGGLMVGACAEGDFGVNAGIVYAHGSFCYGFDLALENFEEGAHCQGGRKMGYHGWYGIGQAYAMLKGDLGVKVNLWFIKRDVSLIDVGLGAILQAGLPSPTWVYGKVRARCSLLGGLFKFNHAIELKAGDVCMPDYGNPLDNIEIFASAAPGDPIKSKGTKELTSPYARPNFITNFEIDKTIRLVDENTAQNQIQNKGVEESEARANSERTYKFVLGNVNMHNATTGTDKWCSSSKKNNDATSFEVNAGSLSPNTDYEMVLTAYAKEFDKKTNCWENPTIDGAKKEKKETKTYYFKTGELEPNLDNEVALKFPSGGKVRYEDATHPHISLKHCRKDLSDVAGYRVEWRLWKAQKLLCTTNNKVIRTNEFEIWQPADSWENFITAGSSGKYRIEIIRVDENWEKAKLAEKKTETKKVKKQPQSTTASSSSQPQGRATSPVTTQIKDFFDEEEKDLATSSIDVTTSKTTAQAKKQDGRTLLYTLEFDNTVNVNFQNEQEFNTAKGLSENIYMAVNSYTMTDNANKDSRTDEAMLEDFSSKQWGFTFKDQYAALSFISNYLGIGGKKIKKNIFYDQEISSSQGITVDLISGKMRKKTNVDGVLKVKPGSQEFKAAHLDFIPFLRSDGESASATARSGRKRYTFNEYNLNRVNLTLSNVINGPVKNTGAYANFMDCFAADAATVQSIQDDMRAMFGNILKKAEEKLATLQTLYDGLSSNDKRLFNMKTQPAYGRTASQHLSFNRWRELQNSINQTKRQLKELYTSYHNSVATRSAKYHRYEIKYDSKESSFSTSAYTIPYLQIFLTLAMSNNLKVGNVYFNDNPVENLSVSKHRNDNKQWSAQIMNTWGVDYTEYLKNLQSVTFDIWRIDSYNINLGKEDCYFSKNKRTYTVQDPFGYNVRKTIRQIK